MTHKRKYILHALVIIASAVVVVSCKIGHHYTRPDVELPVSLTEGESADSASFADRSWTEIYTDSILQNLINKALTYNKDMLMAAARIKELAAMKRIDYAKMFPSLDLRVYGEKEQDNYGGDNPSDDNQFDLKANIAWEVDLWGKLRWNHEASTAEFMASIENRRALQMSLIAQVAQAYYELVALDNELSIVRQTVTADGRASTLHAYAMRAGSPRRLHTDRRRWNSQRLPHYCPILKGKSPPRKTRLPFSQANIHTISHALRFLRRSTFLTVCP